MLSSVPSASSVPRSGIRRTPREPAPLARLDDDGEGPVGADAIAVRAAASPARAPGRPRAGERELVEADVTRVSCDRRRERRADGLAARRGGPPARAARRRPSRTARRCRRRGTCAISASTNPSDRARRDDPRRSAGDEVEAARPAVHVGGEHLDVLAGEQGADDGDAGRAAGAGDEDAGSGESVIQRSCSVGVRGRAAASSEDAGMEMSAVSLITSSGSQLLPPPNRDQ